MADIKAGSKEKSKPSTKEEYKFRHLNVSADIGQYEIPTELVRRPGTNTSGLAVQVSVNSYPVISYPTKTIYQYDVSTSFSYSLSSTRGNSVQNNPNP